MSVTKRIAFGAAASWFSRGVTILLGLVLMPVLFRHLPKEELGVWLLLGQSWAAMGILDLGFGVTLTRRIALAKGKSGGQLDAPLTDTTLREIADLVAAGRRIYRWMALGVFVVAWSLGFFYLRNLELQNLSPATVWIAWTILCACQALTVWATVWTCLLQGVGYIGWDALIASFISAAMLIGQIVVVLCGGGLVALAAIAAVAVLLQRALTRTFARRKRPELFALKGKWNPEVLKGMGGLAFRAWLTMLGAVLVFQTDQFFIASFEGVKEIPAYRGAFVIAVNFFALSIILPSSSSVFISQLWSAGQIAEVQRVVKRNVRVGILLTGCGSAAVLGLGPRLFDFWLGPENFVGYPILLLLLGVYLFEQHGWILSSATRATEDEAFAVWAMLGGTLKLVLAFLLMPRFGLLGLAASMFLAQLMTSHWFTTYRSLARLQLPLREHLMQSVLPCLVPAVLNAAAVWGLVRWLGDAPSWIVVGSACLLSGFILAWAAWLLVLEPNQRHRCTRWVGGVFGTRAIG